jgi:hypothetical protein
MLSICTRRKNHTIPKFGQQQKYKNMNRKLPSPDSIRTAKSRMALVSIAIGLIAISFIPDRIVGQTSLPVVGGSMRRSGDFPAKNIRWQPTKPKASVSEALKDFPNVDATVIGKNGTPSFLRGDFGQIASTGAAVTLQRIIPRLNKIAQILGLTAENLRFSREEGDRLGYKHFVFDVTLHGKGIVGAMVILHVDANGRLYCVNGSVPDEDSEVAILPKVPLDVARKSIPSSHSAGRLGGESLVYFMDSSHRIHLAWQIEVESANVGNIRDSVYVDAVSGSYHCRPVLES